MRACSREYIQKGDHLTLSGNYRTGVLVEWHIRPQSENYRTGVLEECHIYELSRVTELRKLVQNQRGGALIKNKKNGFL